MWVHVHLYETTSGRGQVGPWPRPPAWDQDKKRKKTEPSASSNRPGVFPVAYGGHPPSRDIKGTLIVTKRAAESFRGCYLPLRACGAPSLSELTVALFLFVRIERALIVKDVAG